MPNICWLQLLKCENLILIFIIHDIKQISLGFELLVRQKKTFEEVALGCEKLID